MVLCCVVLLSLLFVGIALVACYCHWLLSFFTVLLCSVGKDYEVVRLFLFLFSSSFFVFVWILCLFFAQAFVVALVFVCFVLSSLLLFSSLLFSSLLFSSLLFSSFPLLLSLFSSVGLVLESENKKLI